MAVDLEHQGLPRAASSRRRRRIGRSGEAGRRARRRTWFVRVAIALIVAVTLLAGLVLILLAVTPSPTSAPARVAALLAAHSAPSDQGQVPAKIATALLATEDSRYRSDWAIDPQGTLRAFWGLATSNPNEGGATIEVQLAKLLYTPKRSDPAALSEQVAIAIKMDRDFSKTWILAMYLDAAYFGDGAYGVTQAAHHYFGLSPDQLSWGQAALLAGLVQAPSRYDPHGHLTAALSRRSHVLARLVAVGAVTRGQAKAIAAEQLDPQVPFSG
jgi:membrane peptidoglycan carboxypeptidase